MPESRVSQITDLVRNWGLHGGDPFTKWFGDLVNSKLGKPDITFQELFDKTGHELVVTASCVNRRMLRFFHRCCHPNMPIVQAVRMSMSIPLFFTPVKYEDAFYCDGGLLNNFPLWVFGTFLTNVSAVRLALCLFLSLSSMTFCMSFFCC